MKALSARVNPSSTQIVLMLERHTKDVSSIFLSVLGSEISSIPDPQKQPAPIYSVPFGISTRLRFLQFRNVSTSIFFNVEGNLIAVIPLP